MAPRNTPLAFVALVLAIPAAAARGVEVAPGQSADRGLLDYNGPRASDELVASRTGTFEFTGEDRVTGEPRVFRGGYNHDVYRSRDDGTLSFRYGASGSDVDGRVVDLEGMTAGGFATFRTDVEFTGWDETGVSRSADGDTLRTGYTGSVSQALFVRTDATAFADGGQFTYHISFQPDGGDPTGVFDTFRPVPEPAAAAVLIGTGAAALRRRRRR